MVIRNLHMKKLIYTALALLFAVSCVEEIPPVIEDVDLSRCFEPTNVTAVVKNGEYVNFNWDKAKTTEVYILELFTNEALEGDPAFHFELDKSEIPYLAHLEADMTYWFRVRGTTVGKDPSKWYVGTKKLETTAIKSILEPVLTDRTVNSISLAWKADPEVDHIRIVLPLHPRTRKILDTTPSLLPSRHDLLTIIPPASFFDINMLEQNAKLVMTDSGGVQKEAFFFEKPCVILRPETEWVEIVDHGAGIIADADYSRIVDAYRQLVDHPVHFPHLFGDAHAAEKILQTILDY